MRIPIIIMLVCLGWSAKVWARPDAPPEAGRWLTQDGSSVIEIDTCGPGLCGRIVGISLDRPIDPAPLDINGQTQCGETIIRMPELRDGRWHGTIGRSWSAQIWRVGAALRLRGFIGLPLLGQTQIWTAFHGATAPRNCAFTP